MDSEHLMVVAAIGITSIMVMVTVALMKGIDGTLFGAAVGVIGTIVGYAFGVRKASE